MPADRGPAAAELTLADRLARSLGGDAGIHETHVSWVVVAGDQAIKLKKPVRFAFVDQSTPERRRALCEEEVRLNQPLAADVVRRVGTLVGGPSGGVELAPEGTAGALDHVVVMRRFDEADTLAERLGDERVTQAQLADVGSVLAWFHADSARAVDAEGPRARWRRNLAELAEADEDADPQALATLYAFGAAFCRRWAPELARRAERGLVRDGHGDLRAEHVLIEGERVLVVDRLEFDPQLRQVDVAEDLAFLTMDLERLGARWAADAILGAYVRAGGDPGPAPLLAFFAAYRALVRAKIAALAGKREKAAALIALAERLAWRARRPLRLLVTGPPASGKSTLARAIAGAADVPLLSSDAVRPRDDEGRGRYDPASRARVYQRLGAAAAGAEDFVVDATFGERRLQEAFFAAFGDREPLAIVECSAPAEVIAQRAQGRPRGGHGESEAGADVAADLLARYVPARPPGVPRLRLDTSAPAERLLLHVAGWVDRL
jgi:aminoglycoside phosphotransferase family enzyme/predicted kinase